MRALSDFEQRGRYWYRKGKPSKMPYVLRDCENCGDPYLAEVKGLKQGKGKFCSLPCADAAKRGDRSPDWIGDAAGYKLRHERVNKGQGQSGRPGVY
jgi:hypothetical protein